MKKFFNSSLESENDGAYLRQQREGDEESKPESSSASVSASEPRSDAKIYIAIAFVVTLVFGSGILIGHYVIGNSDSSNNLEFQYDSTCTEPLVNSMDDRDAIISCLYDVNLKEDVVVPWSSDYYETSQVFSRFYQNYPLAIIYVRTEEEVAATMRCASTYNVRVSARSGGHGNSGNAVSTGAITIDLSNMTAVATNVSTDEVTNVTSAIAMVQAGNTAGTATYFILKQTNFTYTVPVGQKPTVGMGGLTLGGGFGFTTRHAGFLCDRVISIRAVTTNGDIIIANETHHSELLWASCGGGGGNFAVVTEFTYSMFPLLPEITEFHYHIDTTNVSSAAIAMRDYQIFSYHLDSRATCNMEVASQSSANMTGIFLGTVEEFEDVLANLTTELGEDLFPLEGWDLKSTTYIEAVLDLSGWETVTLESLRENFDSERNYYQFKSFLLQEPLPDIAMDMLLAAVNLTVPNVGLVYEFQSLGGNGSAFSAVGDEDTAVSQRKTRHCLMLKSWGPNLRVGENLFGEMSNLSFALDEHIVGSGAYVNHLDYELWNYERAYYGLSDENHWNRTILRLRAINELYDPKGLLDGLQLF